MTTPIVHPQSHLYLAGKGSSIDYFMGMPAIAPSYGDDRIELCWDDRNIWNGGDETITNEEKGTTYAQNMLMWPFNWATEKIVGKAEESEFAEAVRATGGTVKKYAIGIAVVGLLGLGAILLIKIL
jgi:hypothetical protein